MNYPCFRRVRIEHAAAACLLIAAVFDFLFYKEPLGWTLALAHWGLLAAALAAHRKLLHIPPARVIAGAAAVLGFAFVLEPSPLALILSIAALFTLPLIARAGWTTDLRVWGIRWLMTFIGAWLAPVLDAMRYSRIGRNLDSALAARIKGMLSWAIPISFTSVFLAAFSVANPVLDDWFAGAFEWIANALRNLFTNFDANRVIFYGAVFCLAWSLFRPKIWPIGVRTARDETPAQGWLSTSTIVRCLLLFNAAFLLQTALDVVYLWGGAALPEGMTYAQYAHRGAYTLVATALLAAAFVLVTFRPLGETEKLLLARRLVYLWLAQNVLLVLSSIWRLHLYVEVYSLTRLRIAAGLWMLLVACGLVLICWRIATRRPNAWLVGANALATIALLYFCAFVNIPGVIARYNVTHSRELGGEGQPLDWDYLRTLGPAILPSLQLLESSSESASINLERVNQLRAELKQRLEHQTRNWRGWTLRRAAWSNS